MSTESADEDQILHRLGQALLNGADFDVHFPNFAADYQRMQDLDHNDITSTMADTTSPNSAENSAQAEENSMLDANDTEVRSNVASEPRTPVQSPVDSSGAKETPAEVTEDASQSTQKDKTDEPKTSGKKKLLVLDPKKIAEVAFENYEDDDIIDPRITYYIGSDEAGWEKVLDTKANRLAFMESHKDFTKSSTFQDEHAAFQALQRPDTEEEQLAIRNDNSHALIRKCVIGHAAMDLRHLSEKWDPSGENRQRPLDPKLVKDLVEDFKGIIYRAEAHRRLYVSMSQDDFNVSVDHTDEVLGLDRDGKPSCRERICVTDPAYDQIDQMPILLVAADGDGDDFEGPSLPARVEAGQHRRRAMLEFARQLLVQKNQEVPGKMAMGDQNATVAADALDLYGWGVIILDSDMMLDPANQAALAAVRANVKVVAKVDCDGLIVYNAVHLWLSYTPEERKKHESKTAFKAWCAIHLRISGLDVGRIRRFFTTPIIRDTMYSFLASQYGKELYLQKRFDSLVGCRARELVKFVLEAAISRFALFMNIHDMEGYPYYSREDDQKPSFLVSLAEVEAIASCYSSGSGKLNVAKFNQLCYPTPLEDMPDFEGLTPITDYDTQVFIRANMIPYGDNIDRGGREHRRPDFLTFFDEEEYNFFHEKVIEMDDKKMRRKPNPLDLGTDGIFFPTAQWFKLLCKTDLVKFAHLLRFHYYCAVPRDFDKIMPLSTGGQGITRRLGEDFDTGRAFRDGLIQKRLARLAVPEDDDDTPVNVASPLKSGKQAALAIMDQGFKQKVKEQSLINVTTNTFHRYMKALFNLAMELPQSVKDTELATKIVEGYFTYGEQPGEQDNAIKFYEQVLRNQFLRQTMDVFTNHLGKESLMGLSMTFVSTRVGVFSGETDKKPVKFWNIKLQRNLSAHESTRAAVNTYPGFKGHSLDDRNEHVESLEPWNDIMMGSLLLDSTTSMLRSHQMKMDRKFPEGGVSSSDAKCFEGATKGEIDSYESLQEQRSIAREILHRFRNYWDMEEFQPIDKLDIWLKLSYTERVKLLPHKCHIPVHKYMLVTDPDTKLSAVADPYDGKSGQVASIEHIGWLTAYIKLSIYPLLDYVPAAAAKHFAAVEEKAAAERERAARLGKTKGKGKGKGKGKKGKGNESEDDNGKKPLSAKRAPPDSDDESTAPPSKKQKPLPVAAPPLHRPIPGSDGENSESFPRLWAVEEKAWKKQFVDSIKARTTEVLCVNNKIPFAATTILTDWLDIDKRNADHRAAAEKLPAGKRGVHTTAVKKARLALFNEILAKCSVAHVNTPKKHDDLPTEFRYVSQADQKKADEKAAKLTVSKDKKSKGTGGQGQKRGPAKPKASAKKPVKKAAAEEVVDISDADESGDSSSDSSTSDESEEE